MRDNIFLLERTPCCSLYFWEDGHCTLWEVTVNPRREGSFSVSINYKTTYIFIACKVNASTQIGVPTESSCQMQYLVWTLSPFDTSLFHFDDSSKHLLTLKQAELPFFCLLPTDLLPPEHSCRSILRCTRMEWTAPRFCVHWLEKLWFENPKSRY